MASNPIVSQIRALNTNNELVLHDIVDQGARDLIAALGSPTHYIGEVAASGSGTDIHDGATTNPVTIKDGASTKSVTAVSGDIVSKGGAEFIFDGTQWNEFGDLSNLGNFAYADTGSVTIKPKGSNASSSVSFAAHTTDKVLGEATTFALSATPTFTSTSSTDNVLGEATTFTAADSAVTFGNHTTATVLKSDVTATVPKPSGTTKYLQLGTQNLVKATAAKVTAAGSAGTAASFSAAVDSNGVLEFAFIPNTPTTLPTFGTQDVATGAVSSSGTGDAVGTSISAESATATGRVKYVETVSTSGTNSVTFATSGHTAAAITALGTATAAAQSITVGTNDVIAATTEVTGTVSKPSITVGTNDKVTAITALGAATAAAQTFTGTQETYTVNPVPKT